MKSTILHGENQPASRKKFIDLMQDAKKSGYEVIQLNWKKDSAKDLKLLSRSQSLISSGVCLSIENFFTGNKKALQLIEELDPQALILFWEDKQLTPATVKKLQTKYQVLEFPISTTIFNFLNSIQPNNAKFILKQYSETKKKDPTEMVFVMLARHIRMLYWAKVEPETLKVPDWQKKRLESQAQKFSADQLLSLHSKLLDLDRKAKRSQLSENLDSSLELLLLSL